MATLSHKGEMRNIKIPAILPASRFQFGASDSARWGLSFVSCRSRHDMNQQSVESRPKRLSALTRSEAQHACSRIGVYDQAVKPTAVAQMS